MKNNLRVLRKEKRWSQAELGRRLGLAHNTVSGYENGTIPLNPEMVDNFAKALEVTTDMIEIVSADMQREDSAPFRTECIRAELLTDEQLHMLDEYLAGEQTKHTGAHRAKIAEAVNAIGYEKDKRAEAKRRVSSGYTLNEEQALKAHYGKPGAPAASGSPESESPLGGHHSSGSGKGAPAQPDQDALPLTRATRRSQK